MKTHAERLAILRERVAEFEQFQWTCETMNLDRVEALLWSRGLSTTRLSLTLSTHVAHHRMRVWIDDAGECWQEMVPEATNSP